MRREFDHIRELLFQIEKGGPEIDNYENISLVEMSETQAGYALRLMYQKGLISELVSHEFGIPEFNTFYDISMTWEGHDLLDSIRDDEIWKKTKEGAAAAGGFTFDLVKALARGFVKKKIETHTGVELDL